MKSFKQYLEESEKKSLHVFDIDDTLLHTNAMVHVKDKNNNHVKTLSNQEFNDHNLKHGHHYDFSEFRSAKKFHEAPSKYSKVKLSMFTSPFSIKLNFKETAQDIALQSMKGVSALTSVVASGPKPPLKYAAPISPKIVLPMCRLASPRQGEPH